jgi:hypothetical protein
MQLAEYESKYGAPPGDDFDDIAATDDDADANDVQGNDLDDIAVPEHQEEVWEQPVIDWFDFDFSSLFVPSHLNIIIERT